MTLLIPKPNNKYMINDKVNHTTKVNHIFRNKICSVTFNNAYLRFNFSFRQTKNLKR